MADFLVDIYDRQTVAQKYELDTFIELSATRVVNGAGALSVVVPGDIDIKTFDVISISRSGAQIGLYFVTSIERRYAQGEDVTAVSAIHVNGVLDRLIYPADDTQNGRTGAADTLAAYYVSQAIGQGFYGRLTVASASGTAGTVIIDASYRKISDVLSEIVAAAGTNGETLVWDFSENGTTATFRVALNFTGADLTKTRTITTMSGATQFSISTDASSQITRCYAGGSGFETRTVGSYVDVVTESAAVFSYSSAFVTIPFTDVTTYLSALAENEVERTRPKTVVSVEVEETDDLTVGVDVRQGDLVTVAVSGIETPALVKAMEFTKRAGEERARLHLEATL